MIKLPYQIILEILKKFYQFSIIPRDPDNNNDNSQHEEEYDIIDLFGRFKLDRFKKTYLIFGSFYVFNKNQLLNLPIKKGVISIEFDFRYDINENLCKFAKNNLKSFEYVRLMTIDQVDNCVKILNKEFQKFDISICSNVINRFIDTLNERFQSLKFLNVDILFEVNNNNGDNRKYDDFKDLKNDNLEMLSFSKIPRSISFEYMKNLRTINIHASELSNVQIDNILQTRVRKIELYTCKLGDNYYQLFEKGGIEHIDLYFSTFKVEMLKRVVFSKSSSIKRIYIPGIKNIPFIFFDKLFKLSYLKVLFLGYCDLNNDFLEMILYREEKHIWWKDILINVKYGNLKLDEKIVKNIRKTKKGIHLMY